MPIDDNVVNMSDHRMVKVVIPNTIDGIIKFARQALKDFSEADNAQRNGVWDAHDAIIRFGAALLKGRELEKSDKKFGEWIKTNGLDGRDLALVGTCGTILETQQERTAAMHIAKIASPAYAGGYVIDVFREGEPIHLSECEHTWPSNIMRWYHKTKTKLLPTVSTVGRAAGAPKLQEAKDKILAYEARTGKLPPADRHFQMEGVTPSTYDRAIREIRGAREQAGPLRFTKAQDHHVEMRLKAAQEELEREFDARVMAENKRQIDILFPKLEKIQESAKLAEKYHREQIEKNAVFTETEYRDLLLCTHEANPSEETRQRAFMVLNAKKFQLTGKR